MKLPATDMKNSTALPLVMGAAERKMGRFMRAPGGHEGGGDGAPAPAGGDQAPAAAGGADDGDVSALGGASADGDKSGDGEADKGAADADADKSADGDKDADKDGDKEGDDGDKPEVPEAYELKASEGKELDPELVAGATDTLKELGLSNDQAQKLIPLAEGLVEKVTAQSQDTAIAAAKKQATDWLGESKSDETIGGAKWQESLSLSAKAMDALGFDQDFKTFLNDTGIGNKREIIAAFSALGKFVGEDNKFAIGTKGAGGGPGNVAHQMYPDDAPKK